MRLSCFFCAIEEVIRTHLTVSAINILSSGLKGAIEEAIIGSDDVAFFWCLACIEAGEEERRNSSPESLTCGSPFEAYLLRTHGWKCTNKPTRREHNVQKL